jgi:two-component system nitrogen regulation response regulator GlnG
MTTAVESKKGMGLATPATILVCDDDRGIRTVVGQALTRAGHTVRSTANAATLWHWVEAGDGDLVITDVVLPDENAFDLIPKIRRLRPGLRIIVMSAQNTLLTAVKAAERGAFEYLPKPFDLGELVRVVDQALAPAAAAPSSTHGDGEELEEALPLIGRSAAMQDVYRVLARLMGSDLTVMVVGESGTGKELVARALHDLGKRRGGPFVAVNMAAIPRELIESDLFGHEKGAFTGANVRAPGRFEQARGGTLFLDEIGDMPLEAQTRLLRVLQQGEYTTIGGRTPIKADVRIVAATHRDLRHAIREGQFREDLFYRLNVVPIRLPPLRDRLDDLPALARHFLRHVTPHGGTPKALDAAALDRLKAYHWPGNVRELENLMRRIDALYVQEVIGADVISAELGLFSALPGTDVAAATIPDVDPQETMAAAIERHLRMLFKASPDGLPECGLHERVISEVERPLIALTLAATRGNQIRAAELLGINRNTLRKRIRELDIQVMRGIK